MITPLAKLRAEIQKKKLDAVLISSVSNIIYLTNYSGFSKEEREAYLFIGKNAQYILTDGRYAQAVKESIKDYKLIEISSKLSFKDALKNLTKKHKIKKLGFEGHNITFSETPNLIFFKI
jgi:Xaa-Pro aminopeptidase